jgi:hypothetical protein
MERCNVLSVIQGRGRGEIFVEGLILIRSGIPFIMASVWGFVAGVLLLYTGISVSPLTEIMSGVADRPGGVLEECHERISRSPHLIMTGLIVVMFLIASVILNLIGVWAYFIPGVKRLRSVNLVSSTASILIWVGYFLGYLVLVAGLIIGISALVFTISTRNLPGVVASARSLMAGLLMGRLLVLIGTIGLIILVNRLHEHEKNTLYLISAILFIVYIIALIISIAPYIVGLFIVYIIALIIPMALYIGSLMSIIESALLFTAWTLLYMALGESTSRAEATHSQPTPPTPPIPPL